MDRITGFQFRFLRRSGHVCSSVLIARRWSIAAVAFEHLIERQRQIEYFPGIDLLVQYKVDQLREIAPHGCWAAVKMGLTKEQLCPIEFDFVRNAHVTDVAARTSRTDCRQHGFLRANTFHHGIGAEPFCHLRDSRNAFLTAFGHDVGCAELFREFLTRWVPAHRDNPLSAHLFCGKYGEQTDCVITDDHGAVSPGFTLAASAANQPVPNTSEVASRLGISPLGGTSRVGTNVRPQVARARTEFVRPA